MTSSSKSSPIRIVVGTGACLETSMLPYWLGVISQTFQNAEIQVCLSGKAELFITRTAIQGMTGLEPYGTTGNLFDPRSNKPAHIALSESDFLVVCPATPRIIVEIALGSITCPVTRVVAFSKPDHIIFAPWIHYQLNRNLYKEHLKAISDRGITVADTAFLDPGESPWPKTLQILQKKLAFSI